MKFNKRLVLVPVLVALALTLSVSAIQAAGHEPHESQPTIVDVAVSDGRFSTLVAAVSEAGLVDTLSGPGPYTVFAPTDAAFAAALSQLGLTAEELLASPDLADILLYHVYVGEKKAADVVARGGLRMANGDRAPIEVSPSGVEIAGAQIIITDIQTSNGVIHVVDAVMLPPELRAAVAAQAAAAAQAEAEPQAEEMVEPQAAPQGTIVDVAVSDGRFSTLVAAVSEAGLVDTLSGPGPYTVFAPTDAAFAAALNSLGITAEELLASPDLANILLYHVYVGEKKAADVVARGGLRMANGGRAAIEVSESGVTIDGARIIITDIQTSNGVIHVIDAVMLP